MMDEFYIWARASSVKYLFPRVVGKSRIVVVDDLSFYDLAKRMSMTDIYAGIFAEWQINSKKFDTIFLDIDSHKVKSWEEGFTQSFDKLKEVVEKLSDLSLRVYFTGRGFHVYIDFPLTEFMNYKNAVRGFLLSRGIDSSLVDWQVVGDYKRIARVPETINSKVNFTMRRVNYKLGYTDMLEAIRNRESVPYSSKLNDIVDELMKYDIVRNKHESKKVIKGYFANNKELSKMPKCIQIGVEKIVTEGELDHEFRIHIASFLLRIWDYEKVKAIFKKANDYDERITDYQLTYIKENRMKSYMCKNAKNLGFCPYDDQRKCPFYPTVNSWVEW